MKFCLFICMCNFILNFVSFCFTNYVNKHARILSIIDWQTQFFRATSFRSKSNQNTIHILLIIILRVNNNWSNELSKKVLKRTWGQPPTLLAFTQRLHSYSFGFAIAPAKLLLYSSKRIWCCGEVLRFYVIWLKHYNLFT